MRSGFINLFSLAAILLIAVINAGPGQVIKSTKTNLNARNSERHLTKQLLKLVHKLYQNQTLLERRFYAQKHELSRVLSDMDQLKTLVRSIDKQQRVINQEAKQNALSIRDSKRTVEYNHRRFEKFEEEQSYKNQQFEYNESLRKHQQELDEQQEERKQETQNQQYQARLEERQQASQKNQSKDRNHGQNKQENRVVSQKTENRQHKENQRNSVENAVDSPVQPPIAEHDVALPEQREEIVSESPPVPVLNPESLTDSATNEEPESIPGFNTIISKSKKAKAQSKKKKMEPSLIDDPNSTSNNYFKQVVNGAGSSLDTRVKQRSSAIGQEQRKAAITERINGSPLCNHGVQMMYVSDHVPKAEYQRWCMCTGQKCKNTEKRSACLKSSCSQKRSCMLRKLRTKSTEDGQTHEFLKIACRGE